MNRFVALLAVAMLLLALTGCSSPEQSGSSSATLNLAVVAPTVLSDAEPVFETAVREAFPDLNTDGAKMNIQYVSMGDPNVDPMFAMGGMTRVMGMLTAGEIELLICDPDNARRYAEGGKAYTPLDVLFSAEEQAELGIVPASVELVDQEGNLTGEMSAPCGVDLSGCEFLRSTFKLSNLGAYVIVDSPNTENARAVIRYLLTAE